MKWSIPYPSNAQKHLKKSQISDIQIWFKHISYVFSVQLWMYYTWS